MKEAYRRNVEGHLERCSIEKALRYRKSIFYCVNCGQWVIPYDSDPPEFKHNVHNPGCNKARKRTEPQQSGRRRISDYPNEKIHFSCQKCGRTRQYDRDAMIQKGGDRTLAQLLDQVIDRMDCTYGVYCEIAYSNL